MRLLTSKLMRGARIQARIIRALMLRDVMMRYGRDNIGFVWIVLEPMILTAGVMTIWSYTMGTDKYGLKLIEFILTGYMPLTLWRHLTNSMLTLFRRSSPLLYHRQITLFDIISAKLALEFIGTSAAFVVVWGALYAVGLAGDIARLDLLILGWMMMAWLASSVGLILAAMTEWSETSERFVQPMQYLSIPISGAFAMVDWLPTWAQHLILLNPMVHCYEVFRAGYFGSAVVTHYYLLYFASCSFVLMFCGVNLVKYMRARVQLS